MASKALGWIVLGLLKTVAYLYSFLPRKLQIKVGHGLGALFYFAKFRDPVVQQNLNLAYPNDPEKREEIRRASYWHFGNLILEIFMVLGPLRRFVLKYVDLSGTEHLEAAKKRGKGVIFLASHTGNWEVMAATGGVLAQSDLLMVTKHLKPEWLHQAIEAGRSRCEVSATYEPKTMRDVLSHLKRNGTVGIVLDQYVGPPVGVRVPFFGVPVGTSQFVATLAKRTGAAVLPVRNIRTPSGRWDIAVLRALEWTKDSDPNRELAVNTAKYTAAIEEIVRAHPEQWLWIHRRFKGDNSPLRETEWSEPRVRR
jgi:KDO2-lipid IV(A) lauroyltransferase